MHGNASYRLETPLDGLFIATRQKFQFRTVAKEEWFPGSERLAAFEELISPLENPRIVGTNRGVFAMNLRPGLPLFYANIRAEVQDPVSLHLEREPQHICGVLHERNGFGPFRFIQRRSDAER